MKIRALAIIAALATPVFAIADDQQPKDQPTSPSDKPMGQRDQNPPDDTNRQPGDTSRQPSDTSRSAQTGMTKGEKGAKLNEGDVKIVSHFHHLNQAEINLAKIAQKNGTAQVKSYAATLESDHQSADRDLQAFAKNHQLSTIPAEKAQTEADRQNEKDMTQAMTQLKALKGANFDKQYLSMMVSDHDREVARVDSDMGTTNDPDLKNLLQSFKPVLQRHSDQARDLQKSPQASANPSSQQKPTRP